MIPSQPGGSPSPEAGDRRLTDAGIVLTGMHCESCAALISETLAAQPGVANAAVSLESAQATVSYDSDAIGLEDLCAAVVGIGYGATPSSESGPGA
jgi:copper chaperone CopZ